MLFNGVSKCAFFIIATLFVLMPVCVLGECTPNSLKCEYCVHWEQANNCNSQCLASCMEPPPDDCGCCEVAEVCTQCASRCTGSDKCCSGDCVNVYGDSLVHCGGCNQGVGRCNYCNNGDPERTCDGTNTSCGCTHDKGDCQNCASLTGMYRTETPCRTKCIDGVGGNQYCPQYCEYEYRVYNCQNIGSITEQCGYEVKNAEYSADGVYLLEEGTEGWWKCAAAVDVCDLGNRCCGCVEDMGLITCDTCYHCEEPSLHSCVENCPMVDGSYDTNCGCTSCENCNADDDWYAAKNAYTRCIGDSSCSYYDVLEYQDHYCSSRKCTYNITGLDEGCREGSLAVCEYGCEESTGQCNLAEGCERVEVGCGDDINGCGEGYRTYKVYCDGKYDGVKCELDASCGSGDGGDNGCGGLCCPSLSTNMKVDGTCDRVGYKCTGDSVCCYCEWGETCPSGCSSCYCESGTGEYIGRGEACGAVDCSDTDGGVAPDVSGTCTDASGVWSDLCTYTGDSVLEYYCYNNECTSRELSCGGVCTLGTGECRDSSDDSTCITGDCDCGKERYCLVGHWSNALFSVMCGDECRDGSKKPDDSGCTPDECDCEGERVCYSNYEWSEPNAAYYKVTCKVDCEAECEPGECDCKKKRYCYPDHKWSGTEATAYLVYCKSDCLSGSGDSGDSVNSDECEATLTYTCRGDYQMRLYICDGVEKWKISKDCTKYYSPGTCKWGVCASASEDSGSTMGNCEKAGGECTSVCSKSNKIENMDCGESKFCCATTPSDEPAVCNIRGNAKCLETVGGRQCALCMCIDSGTLVNVGEYCPPSQIRSGIIYETQTLEYSDEGCNNGLYLAVAEAGTSLKNMFVLKSFSKDSPIEVDLEGAGIIETTQICFDPIDVSEGMTYVLKEGVLRCNSTCSVGGKCQCTVNDCKGGMLLLLNKIGQPIDYTKTSVFSSVKSDEFSVDFAPTRNGTFLAMAICTNNDNIVNRWWVSVPE